LLWDLEFIFGPDEMSSLVIRRQNDQAEDEIRCAFESKVKGD
jgi:hypothetical protein